MVVMGSAVTDSTRAGLKVKPSEKIRDLKLHVRMMMDHHRIWCYW